MLDQIRSRDSFGISGILSENAEVLYSPLFDPVHLGRMSDVIALWTTEDRNRILKLKVSFILTVWVGYQCQLLKALDPSQPTPTETQNLIESPFQLEFGIDSSLIGIGVRFYLSLNIFINAEGFADRIAAKKPADRFEEMISKIYECSDGIMMRFRPENQEIEIISLHHRVPPTQKTQGKVVDIVILDGPEKQSPQVKLYIELSELSYERILNEKSLYKRIAQSDTQSEDPPSLSKSADTPDPILPEPLPSLPTVPEVQVASKSEIASSARRFVKNFYQKLREKLEPNKKVSEATVETKIKSSDSLAGDQVVKGSDENDPELGLESSESAGELSDSESEIDLSMENPDETTEISGDGPETLEVQTAAGQDENLSVPQMVKQHDKALEDLVVRLQEEVASLEKRLKSRKDKKWIQAVAERISQEKSKINETAQTLEIYLHTHDQNLRYKVQKFQEELEQKDILIKQKDLALEKAKAQLLNFKDSFEKIKGKTSGQVGSADEIQRRLEVALKIASTSRKEVTELRSQVHALQNRESELKHEINSLKGRLGRGR